MSPVSILLAHSQKALKQDSNQQVAWLACFHTTVLTNNKFKNQHLSLSYTKIRIINTAFIFSSNWILISSLKLGHNISLIVSLTS